MSSRRDFVRKVSAFAGTLPFMSFSNPLFAESAERRAERFHALSLDESVTDDDFWGWVRSSYTVSPEIIELNNGGVSPQPKPVQDAHIRFYQFCNEGPSYYMWQVLDQGRESLRMKLAELAGCDTEEIAINRNATEGLNTVIFGLNLKAGDEVILTKQDYPNMINAWKQREKRDGIKLVWLDLKIPSNDEDAIAKQYTDAFTDKTRIVHVTHIINWTGQITPVKKIARAAHAKGIEVICDGAHSFGHFEFKIPELECDYFATSLHKWLCAPFGSGMMYIKKDKIKNVWALLSNNEPDGKDIRKFESLGTRSFASEMAIGNAVDFHNVIGSKRKEERLRYLKNYWVDKVKANSKITINTPKDPLACAIANFSIEGKKPEEISGELMNKYKIHTVGINWENIHGVRVTPHVYTSLSDLDRFIKAVKEMAG